MVHFCDAPVIFQDYQRHTLNISKSSNHQLLYSTNDFESESKKNIVSTHRHELSVMTWSQEHCPKRCWTNKIKIFKSINFSFVCTCEKWMQLISHLQPWWIHLLWKLHVTENEIIVWASDCSWHDLTLTSRSSPLFSHSFFLVHS